MKLEGRTAIVTGANTGIGRVTALELGKLGAHLVLAGRSKERTEPVVEAIRAVGGHAEFVPLDLGDLASVRKCAAAFLERDVPLALLVNNAGLAGIRGATKDGFELAFGTNHLGPYLFTRMLMPALERAGDARIVNVASTGHYRAHGIDWDAVRKRTSTVSGFPEYCVSKLGNVLFSAELARRHPTVRSYSLHPGTVASDVWRGVPWGVRHIMKLFMVSNEEGAKTTLHCATSDDVAGASGRYFDNCAEKKPSRLARDEAFAKLTWERSAEMTGLPN
jgi:NAD(P)-dependent dehydrogenase (short-subunit alcohol dehydrogenase family)